MAKKSSFHSFSERKKLTDKSNRRSILKKIGAGGAIVFFIAGAGHHAGKFIVSEFQEDKKAQQVGEEEEYKLSEAEINSFKEALKTFTGADVLGYFNDQNNPGYLQVFLNGNDKIIITSLKLPEGINKLEDFNAVTFNQFLLEIEMGSIKTEDEAVFSKTETNFISFNGKLFNLNGVTGIAELAKRFVSKLENETEEAYLKRCEEARLAFYVESIDYYDEENRDQYIGKKFIIKCIVNDEQFQIEKFYRLNSETQDSALIERALIEGNIQYKGKYVDITNMLNIVTALKEMEVVKEELLDAGIIKEGEIVERKVGVFGEKKYFIIEDSLNKKRYLLEVNYKDDEALSSIRKESLSNFIDVSKFKDQLSIGLIGKKGGEVFVDRCKLHFITSKEETYSDGQLDVLITCGNELYRKNQIVSVKNSSKNVNLKALIKVIESVYLNTNHGLDGTISCDVKGAQAIENGEDLVEIDGQVMTTKELTNFLIDERTI